MSSIPGLNPVTATRPHPAPIRVVGIDPGLHVTGYAVVEATTTSATARLRPVVVEAGVIRPRGASGKTLDSRLVVIHQGVREVLEAFPPSAVALEQVHSHPAHPRAALLLAHARGVILLAAAETGVPVIGYAASRIKKTLTGSGRAPKEQMQRAIQVELGLDRLPEPHDVADACAVALCHFQIACTLHGMNQART